MIVIYLLFVLLGGGFGWFTLMVLGVLVHGFIVDPKGAGRR